MRRPLLAALLALTLPASLVAQPQEEGVRPPAARAREDVFKMVDAYVVSNLQESLSLSDEQFAQLVPLVRQLQRDRRAFAQRRTQVMQELRGQLASGTATESSVAELLNELKGIEAGQPATLKKHLDAIDAVLTPLQQAKFRVLEVEVNRKLTELMNEIRNRRAAERRTGPPRGEASPPPK